MRIALSVDSISPQPTGIGRYCGELLRLLPGHPEIEQVLPFRRRDAIRDVAVLRNPPAPPRRNWHQRLARKVELELQRARFRRERRGCLVHGPNFFLPAWAEGGVVTIHDLSVLLFPETHPAERIRQYEVHFAKTLKRAGHIITVSETIRRELISFTGIDPARVTAVHNGVQAAFHPRDEAELDAARRRLNLPAQGYGLCVSTIEPRKRIDLLLDAWEQLPGALRTRYPLVLAGASGWLNAPLRERFRTGVAQGWLIEAGYVAEEDLPLLYAGARVFAYPSLYEGFGLPPVEAMASGVPTIVPDASCFPEVTDGAAQLIDPEDTTGFAQAIALALEDEQHRAVAIRAGLAVAARYSWEECMAQTVAVYRSVLGGP